MRALILIVWVLLWAPQSRADLSQVSPELKNLLAGAPDKTFDLRGIPLPTYGAFLHPELQSWVDKVLVKVVRTSPFQDLFRPGSAILNAKFAINYFGIDASTASLLGNVKTVSPTDSVPPLKLWAVAFLDPSRQKLSSWTNADRSSLLVFAPDSFDPRLGVQEITHELGIESDLKYLLEDYLKKTGTRVSREALRLMADPMLERSFQVYRALKLEVDVTGELAGEGMVLGEEMVPFGENNSGEECAKVAQKIMDRLWSQDLFPAPRRKADRENIYKNLRLVAKQNIRLANGDIENFCHYLSRYSLGIVNKLFNHGPRPRMGD